MSRLVIFLLLGLPLGGCALLPNWGRVAPDQDADGIADSHDRCPATPPGLRVDYLGCHRDTDGDSVPDGLDRCPATAAGTPVDYLGCALDSDCDGVIDRQDRCPASPAASVVDHTGCGPGSPAPSPAVAIVSVYFAHDAAVLDGLAIRTLQQARHQLASHPGWSVQLESHADSLSSDAYNLALSQRRGAAVRRWLEHAGVDAGRIALRPYGEKAPQGNNATPDGRARNRRVDLKLISGPPSPAAE